MSQKLFTEQWYCQQIIKMMSDKDTNQEKFAVIFERSPSLLNMYESIIYRNDELSLTIVRLGLFK